MHQPTPVWTLVLCSIFGLGCDPPDDDPDPPEDRVELPDAPDATVWAIEGVRLVDTTGGEPIEEATIVVDGNEFADVGPADEVEVPDNAEVLDLSGWTVLPGLIDSHVHLGPLVVGHDEQRGGPGDVAPDEPTGELVELAPGFVDDGVTTVKSVGDPFPWLARAREALEDEGPDTPTVFAAGPLFTAPDGHPPATIYAANPWLRDEGNREVDDPDDARQLVQEVADDGADLIKIVYDDGDGRFERLDRSVMEAIVEEAGDRDLSVTAHIGDETEANHAIDAGVDGLEHARDIGESTYQRMVDREVFYVPTLSVYDAVRGSVAPSVEQSVELAAEVGVDIVAGSDVGNPNLQPGASLHREMRLLVEAGLSPADALVAATSTAAEFLGEEDELGTIASGARADLLVVDGDPLESIEAAADVQWVVHRGEVVRD